VRCSVLALVLGLAIQAACNSGSATPAPRQEAPAAPAAPAAPRPAGGPDLVSGQASYLRLCAPCHADDGTGYRADHAPSLVNPTFLESATDEFLRRSIIFGRPGTSMAAYGKALGGPLDDAAVTGMVAWLREKGPKARTLPPVPKGEAARGGELYLQYCKSCHGDAKTRGEGPHLANVQFLSAATDAFIKHAIVHGRPKTRMLAFGTVMADEQVNDVVAYVRDLAASATKVSLLPEPTGKEPLVVNPRGGAPAWKPRDGRFVSVDEVAAALKAGKRMVLIDARPPSDWRRVHLAGAVSIPYHDTKRLAEIPKDAWVVAYCACPHHLSGVVVDELKKRGHQRALVLDEGINVWHQRGYPVVAAEGVTVPPKDAPHGHHGHGHEGHNHP
jgi:mono/diheme cytochrome c family protein/rhodanese-related sulfurtransferase